MLSWGPTLVNFVVEMEKQNKSIEARNYVFISAISVQSCLYKFMSGPDVR